MLEPAVLDGLRTAIANVRAVAEAQLREPVSGRACPRASAWRWPRCRSRRAASTSPAAGPPYPSTVVMCAVTARVAGVEEIAGLRAAGPGGRAHPAILAACVLCEVSEVYRMGGAQAIAALAYGTESVPAVDVIVGPGNAWVTEAKRQVFGEVGIDGLAGPASWWWWRRAARAAELIALDLLAQAEHGEDSQPLWLISPDAGLIDGRRRRGRAAGAGAAERRQGRARGGRRSASLDEALARAEEIAPEHLELVGADAEALADR